MFESFKLSHNEGRLIVTVVIDGKEYEKDVTEEFEKGNAHDDWLDYRIFNKYQ